MSSIQNRNVEYKWVSFFHKEFFSRSSEHVRTKWHEWDLARVRWKYQSKYLFFSCLQTFCRLKCWSWSRAYNFNIATLLLKELLQRTMIPRLTEILLLVFYVLDFNNFRSIIVYFHLNLMLIDFEHIRCRNSILSLVYVTPCVRIRLLLAALTDILWLIT